MFTSLPTALAEALLPVLALIHRHHGVLHHATHILGLALKAFIIAAILVVLVIVLLLFFLVRLVRGRGARRA